MTTESTQRPHPAPPARARGAESAGGQASARAGPVEGAKPFAENPSLRSGAAYRSPISVFGPCPAHFPVAHRGNAT